MTDNTLEFDIEFIGSGGDGVARTERGEMVYIPKAIDGEKVLCQFEHGKTKIKEIVKASPNRREAPCPYFGKCGGCSLQHLKIDYYKNWKEQLFKDTISKKNISADVIAPMYFIEEGTRRRVDLSYVINTKEKRGFLGFCEEKSNNVVSINGCLLLTAGLNDFLPKLKEMLPLLIIEENVNPKLKNKKKVKQPRNFSYIKTGSVVINEADNGLDVLIEASYEPDVNIRQDLTSFAYANKLARISWQLPSWRKPEIVIELEKPQVDFGGIKAYLSPASFLQPSRKGEQKICEEILAFLGDEDKRILDLYCGLGSFSFPLLDGGKRIVHGVDYADNMTANLQKSANVQIVNNISVETRNLYENPLEPDEIKDFDVIVFDPPRSGSMAQMQKIAEATIKASRFPKKIIGISCSPTTFARDAAILVDAGYKISKIIPIDQFIYSTHMELVAEFVWA